MRGFVIENNGDESDLRMKIRTEMVQKLAAEWNAINNQIERNSWRCQEDIDAEADYHAEMEEEFIAGDLDCAEREKGFPLTEDEEKQIRKKAREDYRNKVNEQDNEIYVRQDVIEELLSELGARMMRPYEHWNEDERYMEYMENRYNDDYGY